MRIMSLDPKRTFVEVFYFPHRTRRWKWDRRNSYPGSHIRSTSRDIAEKGVCQVRDLLGSFVIHSQSILHRRGASTAEGLRHMLKYSYWRTVPPTRDWKQEPEFRFSDLRSMADTVLRDMWHTCSIGCVVREMNFV